MGNKQIDAIQNREGFYTTIPINRHRKGYGEMTVEIKDNKVFFYAQSIFSVGFQDLQDLLTANNSVDIAVDKFSRRDLKELFFKLYIAKAKEITGRENIKPTWAAKENKLLLTDHRNIGYNEMFRYINLFFSDKVKEVRSFTREKEKAGYSYSVFHGMIEKLKLSNIKLPVRCPECGGLDGHTDNCPIATAQKRKKKEEYDNIMADRGNPDINLVGGFKEKIKENHIGV